METRLIPGNYFPGALGWRPAREGADGGLVGAKKSQHNPTADTDAELITLSTHKWINAHVKIVPVVGLSSLVGVAVITSPSLLACVR